MKKTVLLMVVAIVLLALTVGASAGPVARLKADVPFAFSVGKDLLPAGEYIFAIGSINSHASSSSSVTILDTKGKIAMLIPTMPGWEMTADDNHLHFNRYGDRYFLAKVEGLGYQANMKTSKSEKEARASNMKDQGETLLALK